MTLPTEEAAIARLRSHVAEAMEFIGIGGRCDDIAVLLAAYAREKARADALSIRIEEMEALLTDACHGEAVAKGERDALRAALK